jgi:hypothetical protein
VKDEERRRSVVGGSGDCAEGGQERLEGSSGVACSSSVGEREKRGESEGGKVHGPLWKDEQGKRKQVKATAGTAKDAGRCDTAGGGVKGADETGERRKGSEKKQKTSKSVSHKPEDVEKGRCDGTRAGRQR